MSTSENRWFEVWYSQGENLIPTWILIVVPDESRPGRILIHDPISNNKLLHSADSYDAATDWLIADEYELVHGRQFPDDGWPLAQHDDN
jgi:hypothetical protein